MSDQQVLVLYEDVDERVELENSFENGTSLTGPEPNAYYIPSPPPGKPIRFQDVSRHFPLSRYDPSAHFIFRVAGANNTYTDLTNPAQLVPRLGPHGSVVLKVFRSPCPPSPRLESESLESIDEAMLAPVPPSYFDYLKGMPPGSEGGHKKAQSMGEESAAAAVQAAAATMKAAGRAAAAAMEATGIDEEKVKEKAKQAMSAMKGLWNSAFKG